MDLTVQIAPEKKQSLNLANPIMTASGTFGYGVEYRDLCDIQRLGAIVCKGTTLEPRLGNPQPRITETPSGILNAIGLQNIGVTAVIQQMAPVWATWQVPVIVNIAGNTVEEYRLLAEKLDGVPGISGIEVNISCPNVKEGGAEFGTAPGPAAQVVAAVRAVTGLPVIVKLTPNTALVGEVARAVVAAGADALTLINTVKGMAIDVYRRRPVLGNITGGLSGPSIKPVALRFVYEVSGLVDVPVIGCGGIVSGRDVVEFIMAGAAAVPVGSASFASPRAPLHILEELIRFMFEEKINSLAEIRGIARKNH